MSGGEQQEGAGSAEHARLAEGSAGAEGDWKLCFALAFWKGRDPILKERIFGVSGPEGNHGENAKEYWRYLDATPTPRG